MRAYKLQLQEKLMAAGWEVSEINSETEWWLEEIWVISSIKMHWGFKIYLHFLVDLQYEGTNKSSAVWSVSALESVAKSYSEANSEIAQMYLQKGKFSENLNSFVLGINEHRNAKSL